jgi:putative transposase
MHQEHELSLRQACKLLNISSSVYYYKPQPSDDNEVMEALRELAQLHSSWGFWMMYYRLRTCNYTWNHKKVYRIYTMMKLNMRRKFKRRLPTRVKNPLVYPIGPNITWSMDFVHDGLISGKAFRSFNVLDDFNREALNITIDTSLTSKRVIRELNTLIDWRGKPEKIRVDNGPEFIAQALECWAEEREIELTFIQKGKPQQNALVERFNRTYKEEVLDKFAFDTLKQTQVLTNAWMWVYNNERPHSSLQYHTPASFLLKYGKRENTFPTFQQDCNNDWKSLLLDATN